MSFHVGQKVLCLVASSEWRTVPAIAYPTKGAVYVIRSICRDHTGDLGLRFHWLINPVRDCTDGCAENAFSAYAPDGTPNFRPVVERSTSIEIFERMLTPKQVETV